jgi:tetratricopeptide (TPR) repeat protein
MNRLLLNLAALLMAGCAAVEAAAQPGHQSGASSAGLAAPVEVQAAPGTGPRAKTSTVGAELAEHWSPAVGVARARYADAPTTRNEILLAHAHYSMGILDQAYDYYAEAARRDPREAAAWDGLARIWRDWGYPSLGLGDAHRAVWANPRSPVVHNTLGTVLARLGKHHEASRAFARAVVLDPSAGYAYYNLAMALEATGQHEEATRALERAAALDSSIRAADGQGSGAAQPAMAAAAGKGGSHERR